MDFPNPSAATPIATPIACLSPSGRPRSSGSLSSLEKELIKGKRGLQIEVALQIWLKSMGFFSEKKGYIPNEIAKFNRDNDH